MGGAIDNTWIAEPEKPCVIVGTQDQILSRQLNRGYACSRWSWPQHFALLNNDCELFIDECQLMGVGYSTSIELSHWRKHLKLVGNCRVIWSSATLDISPLLSREIQAKEVNLSPSDYANEYVGKKVSRIKRLHQLDLTMSSNYTKNLAHVVLAKHITNTMTLVIVNQVSRAISVFEALQHSGVPLKLLHSRFRRAEREKLVEGLEDFKGIIIATQVVEAGVDLDARTLFTELASWSSLVQRFGRCGRNNKYPNDADIYWVNGDTWPDAAMLPYERSDCQYSLKILESLNNASIQNLLSITSPPQNISEVTLTRDDLKKLFDNHPPQDDKDIDVSGLIRIDTRPTINVAWVDSLPPSDWSPTEGEICSVPRNQLEKFRPDVYIWDEFTEEWKLKNLTRTVSVQCALLLTEWGGYSNILGFTGKSSDQPQLLTIASQENVKSGWDRPAYLEATQAQHGSGQANEMARIRQQLSHLGLPEWLDEVAALSDWGKSHPVWQKSATGLEKPTVLLSKSTRLGRHDRKGFRHEMASGLAILQSGKPFHYAYLASTHHGKCRIQFCPWVWDEPNCTKGIKSGDSLPATDLGIFQVDNLTLNIPSRISWESKVDNLVGKFGIFRLAYLETLIRAADIADSKKYEQRDPEGV